MKLPKLTVVIPTRERADTLFYTLQTVIEQEYENLEIIVSDNASLDDTKVVVDKFFDHRLKYINTSKRVGMSENWEFALQHVTGDFVMYLGDDDGLLPNACRDIATILVTSSTKAVIWSKPNYNWSSNLVSPNEINIKICYDLVEMESRLLLRAVADGRTSYGRLPVLYAGFVSMETIVAIKNITGNFFHSITPDVYSGIVLADALPNYLYSFRPFSINGGSGHSTGIATVAHEQKAQLFFTENSIKIHPNIPIIRGSIQTHVAESFLQAQKVGLLKNYHLNYKKVHKNIFNEVMLLAKPLRSNGLQTLLGIQLSSSLRRQVEAAIHNVNSIENKSANSVTSQQTISNSVSGYLFLDASKFLIHNSYDSCLFFANLLGPYQMPAKIVKANLFSYGITVLRRKLSFYLQKYLLPI